jgi:hypothetical protein
MKLKGKNDEIEIESITEQEFSHVGTANEWIKDGNVNITGKLQDQAQPLKKQQKKMHK